MNEIIHILSIKGNHSTSTREEFIAGMQARGATVELRPSRLGDFDVVKVNDQAVARAFKSQGAMLQYMIVHGMLAIDNIKPSSELKAARKKAICSIE